MSSLLQQAMAKAKANKAKTPVASKVAPSLKKPESLPRSHPKEEEEEYVESEEEVIRKVAAVVRHSKMEETFSEEEEEEEEQSAAVQPTIQAMVQPAVQTMAQAVVQAVSPFLPKQQQSPLQEQQERAPYSDDEDDEEEEFIVTRRVKSSSSSSRRPNQSSGSSRRRSRTPVAHTMVATAQPTTRSPAPKPLVPDTAPTAALDQLKRRLLFGLVVFVLTFLALDSQWNTPVSLPPTIQFQLGPSTTFEDLAESSLDQQELAKFQLQLQSSLKDEFKPSLPVSRLYHAHQETHQTNTKKLLGAGLVAGFVFAAVFM
ncbi:hypothetical protein BASA81_000008 [Batrachochytrium salamandrivorans]|nr:hypothetical protein BASA81_000008 [Batrachochytrium salamandrivorans]